MSHCNFHMTVPNAMASLLVTGGAGFIGANFVHYWLRQHPDDTLVVLDALTYAGNRSSLAGLECHANFTFVHGNICNTDKVIALLQQHRVDTIVHFAAESHVDRSIQGPDTFIQTNITGTHSLLKAARQVWIEVPALHKKAALPHRFHHVSTDEVFGSLAADQPAFTEDTPYAPNSPYSASKAAADHLVRAYHQTYGLATTLSRCSNNYGPYHYPEKLIPLTLTNILHNRPIPVFGDGLQVRDWLYVLDHVRAIEAILTQDQTGDTWNVGARCELTNLQLIHKLCQIMDHAFATRPPLRQQFAQATAARAGNSASLIRYVQDRPGHDRRYAMDPTKIEQQLGFVASEPFDAGIAKTVDWFLDNEPWWRSAASQLA
ncbi:dTDP-glucose 4,6-dehydratase [Advenella incenata]|uniref:dTDP-glucose 4,6-dehydratase n=2 Tax=Advenella incenata TaxID=267800 RepID=A0A4Q7VDP4_9BURK|nr:dTDP-glucose 4,6-dehydratase [Advenella incenata]